MSQRRNWLRFARPSQFGVPWQEISKHLTVFVTDFVLYYVGKRAFHSYKTKSGNNLHCFLISCGEGGIRTPGTSQYAGFQDRCNRPLCHLSKGFLCLTMWSFRFDVAKVYQRFEPCKSLQEKFQIFFQIRAFWAVFLFVYYVFH